MKDGREQGNNIFFSHLKILKFNFRSDNKQTVSNRYTEIK